MGCKYCTGGVRNFAKYLGGTGAQVNCSTLTILAGRRNMNYGGGFIPFPLQWTATLMASSIDAMAAVIAYNRQLPIPMPGIRQINAVQPVDNLPSIRNKRLIFLDYEVHNPRVCAYTVLWYLNNDTTKRWFPHFPVNYKCSPFIEGSLILFSIETWRVIKLLSSDDTIGISSRGEQCEMLCGLLFIARWQFICYRWNYPRN